MRNKISETLKVKGFNDSITCADAFSIAHDLELSPQDVGKTLDSENIHIKACQLGLFGYNPKKKIVKEAENVSQKLINAIERLKENGRVPCKGCWDIANDFQINKIEVANACEKLNIKISSCQLGAF